VPGGPNWVDFSDLPDTTPRLLLPLILRGPITGETQGGHESGWHNAGHGQTQHRDGEDWTEQYKEDL